MERVNVRGPAFNNARRQDFPSGGCDDLVEVVDGFRDEDLELAEDDHASLLKGSASP
jgi:hypothetical protein